MIEAAAIDPELDDELEHDEVATMMASGADFAFHVLENTEWESKDEWTFYVRRTDTWRSEGRMRLVQSVMW